jgi:hypothetical protein
MILICFCKGIEIRPLYSFALVSSYFDCNRTTFLNPYNDASNQYDCIGSRYQHTNTWRLFIRISPRKGRRYNMSSKKTQTKVEAGNDEQPVDEETEQPKTKASKKTTPSKPLPEVDDKYQNLANLNYQTDAKARQAIIDIIDEVSAIEDELLVMSKTSEHDLSIRYNGRTLIRVCPLKTQMSASINGAKILRTDKEEVLKSFHKLYEDAKKEHSKAVAQAEKAKADDEKSISEIEARIAKLDAKSKGINLGKLKVTEGITNWVAEKGYVLEGTNLNVR